MLTSHFKVSALFESWEVNIVTCKLLVNYGTLVNILSYDVSKMFDCGPEPCDTKMYAFHSSKFILVLGKFKAPVESKCCSVDSESLVVDDKTSLLRFATATELETLQIANAVSVERNVWQNSLSPFSCP